VVWPRPATFGDIVSVHKNHILSFIQKYNGTAAVVFDGYEESPSTKDPEHQRRTIITSSDLVFDKLTPITTSQGAFLTNSANKERLISLLSPALEAAGIAVSQSKGDADRDIVMKAVSLGEVGGRPVIVGKDTDLLVLMISLTPQNFAGSMLISSYAKGITVRNSNALQDALGPVAEHLLFFHAAYHVVTLQEIKKNNPAKT